MYFVLFKVVIHVFCSSQADLQMIIGNIMHAHYAAQILFMNVIFGSIIGVFGKLREKVSRPESGCEPFVFAISTVSSHLCTQKLQAERMKMNVCYICSVSRRDIEKTSSTNGFDQHRNSRHNLLSYVRFIFYIRSKNPNHLTGLTPLVI